MARAVLVAGDEARFEKASLCLSDYLSQEACISDIRIIKSDELNPTKLSEVLLDKPGTPILLIYNGHGSRGGWAYTYDRCFRYYGLAKILKQIQSPIYIINDCCYAFSIVGELIKHERKLPTGLLAAGPKNKKTYMMYNEVIKSWRQCKIYDSADYQIPTVSRGFIELIHLAWNGKVVGGLLSILESQCIRYWNLLLPSKFKIQNMVWLTSTFDQLGLESKITGQYQYERPRWGEVFDPMFFSHQLKLNFD